MTKALALGLGLGWSVLLISGCLNKLKIEMPFLLRSRFLEVALSLWWARIKFKYRSWYTTTITTEGCVENRLANGLAPRFSTYTVDLYRSARSGLF